MCLWLPVLLLCFSSVAVADNQILIITTSDSNYQQLLSTTIQNEFSKTPYESRLTNASQLEEHSITGKELVVAIGKDSITIIRKNSYRMAILKILTESEADNTSEQRVNESTIYMTQPLCRQFRLIKALHPGWKTVGMLLAKENHIRASTISACARKYGLTIRTETVDDNADLITSLNIILNNSDVLLSLPDPAIYNSRNIKNILLTSYRHRVPIIGFSESFTHAGAIAAVHTSPEQLGKQVAGIIRSYFENNSSFIKAVYYPEDFTVTTNQQVARSLEIDLDDAEKIESVLRKLEKDNE